MINEFFLSDESYENMSITGRLLSDLTSYRANSIFYDRVIDILVVRYPDYDNRSEEVKSQIDEMLHGRTAACDGFYYLSRFFEVSYGKITDEVMDGITETATELAEHALKAYGWIKEKEGVM